MEQLVLEYQQKVDAALQEKAAAEERATTAIAEADAKNREIESLQNFKEAAESSTEAVESLKVGLKSVEAENQRLQKAVDEAELKIASKESALAEVTKRAEGLEKEKESLESKVASIKAKLEAAGKSASDASEAEKASLKKTVSELKNKEAAALKTADVASAKLEALMTEHKAASHLAQKLAAEKEDLLAKVEQSKSSGGSYVFSFDQFVQTGRRVYVFLSAAGLYTYDSIRMHIPNHLILAAEKVFEDTKAQTISAIEGLSVYQDAKLMYKKYAEYNIEFLSQKISDFSEKAYAKAYEVLSVHATNVALLLNSKVDNIVEASRFFDHYPEQKSVIYPESLADKVCVLGYLAAFTYVFGWIPLKVALRVFLSTLHAVLCCGLCRRRKSKSSTEKAKNDKKKDRKHYPDTTKASPTNSGSVNSGKNTVSGPKVPQSAPKAVGPSNPPVFKPPVRQNSNSKNV